MTYSFILDGGLNIVNNVTNITGFTDPYYIGSSDCIIYSTDASPHDITMPLAAQAGVGKTYYLCPTFGWSYVITFQGSDSTNGLPSTNPVYTSNSSVSFTSNGADLWIMNSGVLTD